MRYPKGILNCKVSRENIWTISGPEFGAEEEVTLIIVKMALYGLKSPGAVFLEKLAGVIHDLGYMPTKSDPDLCINPVVNPDGSEYCDIVLCYVYNLLAIPDYPMKTIVGIKSVFKLK